MKEAGFSRRALTALALGFFLASAAILPFGCGADEEASDGVTASDDDDSAPSDDDAQAAAPDEEAFDEDHVFETLAEFEEYAGGELPEAIDDEIVLARLAAIRGDIPRAARPKAGIGESCTKNSDCDDDAKFCNGVPFCADNVCVTSGNPCIDGTFCNGVENCVEESDQCFPSVEEKCPDDGAYCNGVEVCDEENDKCGRTGNPCSDGVWCNGTEDCVEDGDICPGTHSDPPCPANDGVFCNGRESCAEPANGSTVGTCGTTMPCPSDGIFCNGQEYCDTEADACAGDTTDLCPDDGLYCNGIEYCDSSRDACASDGNPCSDGVFCNGEEACFEDRDECGPASEPPCPDDGKFCNGEEFCDTESDACASEGSPCNLTVEVCVDDEDTCKAVEDLEVGGDGLGDGDKDGGCCSC